MFSNYNVTIWFLHIYLVFFKTNTKWHLDPLYYTSIWSGKLDENFSGTARTSVAFLVFVTCRLTHERHASKLLDFDLPPFWHAKKHLLVMLPIQRILEIVVCIQKHSYEFESRMFWGKTPMLIEFSSGGLHKLYFQVFFKFRKLCYSLSVNSFWIFLFPFFLTIFDPDS